MHVSPKYQRVVKNFYDLFDQPDGSKYCEQKG